MLQDSDRIRTGRDVWIPTVCNGCYNCCSVKVHRVDGRIVDVIGDPRSPNSRGYICAKGKSRILDIHHPGRVLKPMIRTNPDKGIGVDPRWKEISWDEALNRVVERLQDIRERDPRKLILSHFDIPGYRISGPFAMAFGTPNFHWNRADYCGSAAHIAWLLINGSFNAEVDYDLCKYVILWGTQLGHLAETMPLQAGSKLAEARRRGTKLVVIDPFCSNAAAKADEWIPIKPGTDGALALGMLHVMVHELGVYDRAFLEQHTNGPYLTRPDGHYARDPESGKPLVLDGADGLPKPFDAEDLHQPVLEGEKEVGGVQCRTAFQALKDHLAQYTPEEMSRVCTVPVGVIRRIAREFCETANIGATVEIRGHRLPYRPVGIHFKRGSSAHKGGFHTDVSMHLLNVLVGAVDVPGGQRGVNPIGPFWSADASPDGLIVPDEFITKYNRPYPPSKAQVPQRLDLAELFPAGLFTRGMFPWGIDHPEAFGIDYKPEAMIHGRTNLMMSSHNARAMEQTLRKIPFMVSIDMFVNETEEFADIFLPEAHDFERWELFPANDPYAFITPGPGEWFWTMRQAVAPPPEEARPWTEVYLEIADRLGILDDIWAIGNDVWVLGDAYKLEPGRKYTIREIAERQAKTIVGDHFDWDMFGDTSAVITREKTIEEAYPRPFMRAKIPVYFEHLLSAREDLQEVIERIGLNWNLDPYGPLPRWIPCPALEGDETYDLISMNFKVPFHTFSISAENLWIDEISRANPYTYKIMLNRITAERKGLRTGDSVWVTSPHGRIAGQLFVTELIHPESVGIGGTFGHWARKMPIARGKGACYNDLLPSPELDRIDPISGQIDMCVNVNITKQ